MLPSDFGPWQTVYWWFRRFVRRLLFRTIHDVALMLDRERRCRSGVAGGTAAHRVDDDQRRRALAREHGVYVGRGS